MLKLKEIFKKHGTTPDASLSYVNEYISENNEKYYYIETHKEPTNGLWLGWYSMYFLRKLGNTINSNYLGNSDVSGRHSLWYIKSTDIIETKFNKLKYPKGELLNSNYITIKKRE